MTNYDEDHLLALELQKQFENEVDNDVQEIVETKQISKSAPLHRKRPRTHEGDELNLTQNLVHPQWETLDPTPDIYSLFGAFDSKFFQSRLKCVALEWSKKMYTCAGICYSKRNQLGMSITIRLSEPLLKLRSRKDLVETLLHEMIHAYCFVLGIREGNGGHGPNFKKIMCGINGAAGTNITVYHSFHDEVNIYKTHWWRCNGVCQNRKPFYGYVKRTSNRAPGSYDNWWGQHMASCGGTFMKIKEPEPKAKKKTKETRSDTAKPNKTKPPAKPPNTDLRKFFPGVNGPIKTNGGGTLLLNPRTKPVTAIKSPPVMTSTPAKTGKPVTAPGGNLRNVFQFKDIGGDSPVQKNTKPSDSTSMTGQGYSLANTGSSIGIKNSFSDNVDREKLRNMWANRFPSPAQSESSDKTKGGDKKRRRISNEYGGSSSFKADEVEKNDWTLVDDDVLVREVKTEVIDLASSDDDEEKDDFDRFIASNKWSQITQDSEERHKQIKKEILDDDFADLEENDIELIDDDYDEDINTSAELADTSLVDDLFGEDTLLKSFVINRGPSTSKMPSRDMVSCPICQTSLDRDSLSDHLDGCGGIVLNVSPKRPAGSFIVSGGSATAKMNVKPSEAVALLRKAGYTEADLVGIFETEEEVDSFDESSQMQPCPVCLKPVLVDKINEHLDTCLME